MEKRWDGEEGGGGVLDDNQRFFFFEYHMQIKLNAPLDNIQKGWLLVSSIIRSHLVI